MSSPFISPTADSIPFDNDSNGFVAEDLQAAVEEAKNSVASGLVGLMYTHSFVKNGRARDTWVDNTSNGIVSNQSPHTVVWRSQLVGLSFSCSRRNTDVDLEFYVSKEGNGNSEDPAFLIWEIRDKRVLRKTDFISNIILDEGDKLAVFARDQGTDLRDLELTTYWTVLEENEEEAGENYAGNF